ncbi:MAG: tyrosine-type recombinase/integrase [Candidatus Zixiibacteriota bacterium]
MHFLRTMPAKQKWRSLSKHFGRKIRSQKDAERALIQWSIDTGIANATLQWHNGSPQAVWQDHSVPSQTIAGFVQEYLEAQADRVAPETYRHLETYLAHFLNFCRESGFRSLEDIGRRDMERYVFAAPGSPRTKRHYLNAARAALNAAVRWRLIDYNPAMAIPVPVDRHTRARRVLTDDEIRTITEQWQAPEREFALIGIWAGLRLGEIRHLAWDDVDLEKAEISITAKPELGFSPKGTRYRDGRPDIIPIVPWLVDMLRGLPRIGRFVFDRGDDHPLWSAWTWQKRLTAAAQAHQMPHVSPHALRHTFCTKLALAGVNRAIMPTIARHLDAQTTDQYIHATLQDARRELAKLRQV